MDMESRVYMAELPKLVKEGKVDARLVEDAAGRILTKKFEMGLFDDPYRFSNEKDKKIRPIIRRTENSEENLALKVLFFLKIREIFFRFQRQ